MGEDKYVDESWKDAASKQKEHLDNASSRDDSESLIQVPNSVKAQQKAEAEEKNREQTPADAPETPADSTPNTAPEAPSDESTAQPSTLQEVEPWPTLDSLKWRKPANSPPGK